MGEVVDREEMLNEVIVDEANDHICVSKLCGHWVLAVRVQEVLVQCS